MPTIKHYLIMGDSLSDRGTMNRRYLFGFIPMGNFSGLQSFSPMGRFTNGLVWGDHLAANIANDFTIKRLVKKWQLDNTDISDAVITNDRKILKTINKSYSLDDDRFIKYQGKAWVRSYCEGGLTAHNYGLFSTACPKLFFYRIIMSTLKHKRTKILSYDESHRITYQDKAQTLVLELSGANDLITVNHKPSVKAVNKAIIARTNNVKRMIATGYRHFILFNLPNLALAPRFNVRKAFQKALADRCSQYFNTQLKKAVAQLQKNYPHCSVRIFDINAQFQKIYANPEHYYFDKDKRTIPYNKSIDFNDPSDGQSPACGYMFYDDIHPTADMHALLAAQFYDEISKHYELIEPNNRIKKNVPCTEEQLLSSFRHHYAKKLRHDQHRFFGIFCHSRFNYKQCSLAEIVKEALDHKGKRTFSVLKELGWLNNKGDLTLELDPLQKAYARVRPDYKIDPDLQSSCVA